MRTTWHRLIEKGLRLHEESWDDVEACTLTESELDVEFDDGWGGSSGKPFTAWTADRVYFPAVYDGSEWASSAPRNPCGEAIEHVGGE